MRLVPLLLGCANARLFMGIANPLFNNVDYERVGRFCFVIPPGARGIVSTEILVRDPGHRLILTQHSENFMFERYASITPGVKPMEHPSISQIKQQLEEIQRFQGLIKHGRHLEDKEIHALHTSQSEESTTSTSSSTSSTSSTISAAESVTDTTDSLSTPQEHSTLASIAEHGLENEPPVVIPRHHDMHDIMSIREPHSMCEAIVQHAAVMENLRPLGTKTAYTLVLLAGHAESGQDIDIWVTRCGFKPHAHYKISVMNPGSLFNRHFGCREQGVLQTALLSAMIYLAGLVPLQKLLQQCAAARREHPVIDAFLLACGAAGIHTVCHAMHILAFAFDGMGVRALAFVGDLAHWAFITAASFVVLRLVLNKRFAKSRALLDTTEDRGNSGLLGEANILRSYVTNVGITGLLRDPLMMKRALASVIRLALSNIGLWLLLSSSGFCAMLLQGMKGLFAPDSLIVPDFEFLHPTTPHYGSTFAQYLLITVIRIHWAFRILLGYVIIRMLLISRRLTPGRQIGAYATIVWCLAPPLNGILFQAFHRAHQFLIQLVITGANMGLLLSLGYLIMENPKYGSSRAAVKKPLFTPTNDSAEIIKMCPTEEEPQLIDLTRIGAPTGDFNVMRRDAR